MPTDLKKKTKQTNNARNETSLAGLTLRFKFFLSTPLNGISKDLKNNKITQFFILPFFHSLGFLLPLNATPRFWNTSEQPQQNQLSCTLLFSTRAAACKNRRCHASFGVLTRIGSSVYYRSL